MNPCLEQRKGELLDGRRKWDYQSDAAGDYDVFYSEFVVPLRELKCAGFFSEARERKINSRGGIYIGSFTILGAVNYNAQT